MATTYLVTDIETIPDNSLWSPPPPDIERVKIEKEKSSKPDLKFLDVIMDLIDCGVPVHPLDAEKAYGIADREPFFKPDRLEQLKKLLVPEETKDHFPPTHAHRPIVIGCVWLNTNLQPLKVGSMKISGGPKDELDEPEKNMLTEWNQFMTKEKPVIVSWYGRGFDLPVLTMRSFRHGVPMQWYFDNNYRYRYSEDQHVDLCDVMSDFGAVRERMKLDAVSKLLGLPGKPTGEDGETMDGSKVGTMFNAGRLEDVATYCITDCLQTAWAFQRWRLVKGRIDLNGYQEAASALLAAVDTIPKLAFFRKQINDKTLLLQSQSQEPT